MYNIDTSNIKKGYKFYLIFLILGITMLGIICSILISSYLNYKKLDSSTISTSVDFKEYEGEDGSMYKPIYDYNVNGRTYSCISKWSSNIKPKNSLKIYYDSKNPENCLSERDKTSNYFFLFFLILPIPFTLLGLIGILNINKRLKKVKYLSTRGRLIRNLPYHLEDSNITINDTGLKKIVVMYNELKFESDPRYDTNTLEENGFADLLIDETNPKNYYIDIHIS